MASANRVIVIGNLGRVAALDDEGRRVVEDLYSALHRYAQVVLGRQLDTRPVKSAVDAQNEGVGLTFQDVCRMLHEAQKAVRDAGIRWLMSPSSVIPKGRAFARGRAFFHAQKVDDRNLP